MPDDFPAALVPGLTITEALDAVFAAYVERYGPARGAERLRLMLMRSYEAQQIAEKQRARERVAALQTGCPYPIAVIGEITGSYSLESSLHRKFEHLHAYGEWFRDAPELRAFIADQLREKGQ